MPESYAIVGTSSGIHLPTWAVALFVVLWVIAGITLFYRKTRHRRGR